MEKNTKRNAGRNMSEKAKELAVENFLVVVVSLSAHTLSNPGHEASVK
jgi:hypothetical protein